MKNLKTIEIYNLGRKLELKKGEIDDIIDNPEKSYKTDIEYKTTNPFDLYKTGGHYGTISIKDFSRRR